MNDTLINNQKYIDSINDFYQFSKTNLGLTDDPVIIINFDPQEEQDELQHKTGMYDPDSSTIWLFCHGRHLKDILRSFGHELVHYKQHVDGELTDDILNAVQTNYDIDDPTIQSIEGPAFQNGSFLLRKYTQLNESVFDIYSKYVTNMDNKRKEEQKKNAVKVNIKKRNTIAKTYQEPKERSKFDKLEEIKPQLADMSYLTGPQTARRFGQDIIHEFDELFQEIFSNLFDKYNFTLENYSEPGLFYEYTLGEQDFVITITILPNGVKNNLNYEQIQDAILSVTIQDKNNKDSFDFTFKKMKQLYIKLNKILKSMIKNGDIDNES